MIRFGCPPSLGFTDAAHRGRMIADVLVKALGEEVQARVAPDYRTLGDWVESGQVAVAWAPPSVCGRLVQRGARVLSCVRDGVPYYRGAVVARRDAKLTPTRLAGRSAAWVDPHAMAGYLLPRLALEKAGFDPDRLGKQEFLGSYRRAMQAVVERRSDVGAAFLREMDGPLPRGWAELSVPGVEDLAIIATSPECPNDGVVISPALEPRVASDVARTFLALGGEDLKSCFDAQALEPAKADDYAAVAALLVRHGPELA
jgi:phosphonate transport system substrate-binding protein